MRGLGVGGARGEQGVTCGGRGKEEGVNVRVGGSVSWERRGACGEEAMGEENRERRTGGGLGRDCPYHSIGNEGAVSDSAQLEDGCRWRDASHSRLPRA